jgi:hypothetical protein
MEVEVDASQRVYLNLAHAIDLADPAGTEDEFSGFIHRAMLPATRVPALIGVTGGGA